MGDFPLLLAEIDTHDLSGQRGLQGLSKRVKSRRILVHPDKLSLQHRPYGERATKLVALAETILIGELPQFLSCSRNRQAVDSAWNRWRVLVRMTSAQGYAGVRKDDHGGGSGYTGVNNGTSSYAPPYSYNTAYYRY